MIKKIAWDTFKNTGSIDTFLEFKQIKDIEENIQKVEQNGNYKNKWNNNIGK
jgi:hypothetical protein